MENKEKKELWQYFFNYPKKHYNIYMEKMTEFPEYIIYDEEITDSKKYEEDFIKCFQLEERRTGEICNACVLLVKRWKKLPVGSSRNWRHVCIFVY